MDHSVCKRRGRFRGRSFQAIVRERSILLCRIWTALMLKRAIRFVESTQERDWRDLNLNKAKVLVALRCLHDEIVDGPPLAGSHAPIDDDRAKPTTTMW
jgi:hypothetical protein